MSDIVETHLNERSAVVGLLTRVIDRVVATASEYAPVSRLVLFGSYGRGRLKLSSDLDLLVLVAPPRSARWRPKENVSLRSLVYQSLGQHARSVDLSVRTIDQYEEAHTVPVCPEHSAASEGAIVWSAATSRRPQVTRSPSEVRRDNAIDWLRFALHASDAMRDADAKSIERICGLPPLGDAPALAPEHHDKCVRAAIVAWAIATESAIPDHTLPLARVTASINNALGQRLCEALADLTPSGRSLSAMIAITAATESVRKLLTRQHR
jgi:predicted nucleotidyltransferase